MYQTRRLNTTLMKQDKHLGRQQQRRLSWAKRASPVHEDIKNIANLFKLRNIE